LHVEVEAKMSCSFAQALIYSGGRIFQTLVFQNKQRGFVVPENCQRETTEVFGEIVRPFFCVIR